MRCQDDWWNEVVDELRDGKLSEKNYKYLHGLPVEGCTLSPEERRSRKRVADGPRDPRLREEKFVKATVVVANNDAKYQINKDRAKAYARDAGTRLHWSVAKDKAGVEALQAQACDKEAKVRWLQYHDMDTEGLCGMLPLAIGMPVALTHHVDRSEKLLLKGRVGYVHSWVWHDNDQQPSIVHRSSTRSRRYVKFEGADWILPGSKEPGLYPILPISRTWKLDKGRKNAVLKVSRTQIPLITAHASQGKTAVMLDLNVDSKTHAAYGTVVASRVRSRFDLLILRPFPLWLFQRGTTEGPTLLLRKLRGEDIDWEGMQDARWPRGRCGKCRELKTWDLFAHAQWELVRANRTGQCLACQREPLNTKAPVKRNVNMQAAQAKSVSCSRCHFTKDFTPTMRTMPDSALACIACQQKLPDKTKRLRTG
ncbi:pfh1, partial [Symbiodinium sp. CCMP2456]